MMKKISRYKTALLLSVLAAFTTSWVWVHLISDFDLLAALCAFTWSIPFGIWVQSSFVRYAGALFMALIGGLMAMLLMPYHGTFSSAHDLLIALIIFLCVASNLLAAIILLFSGKFRAEFAEARKNQRPYKRYLKWMVALVVILIAANTAPLMTETIGPMLRH